eukprot:TRINITY_DN36379_c0_g2_i2.p1 TRINITY_DN36379_c0_g2~~TRINITY_DN36379_c0_g2_i2.p1  ORF type:complete len:361 (-),score=85.26 TRINITY_DN36379_c0_g2_i2:80-1162(-)
MSSEANIPFAVVVMYGTAGTKSGSLAISRAALKCLPPSSSMNHDCCRLREMISSNLTRRTLKTVTKEEVLKAVAANEVRVKLAMQSGIHPLLVLGCHARLAEMTRYAKLAQASGYEVCITSPEDIVGGGGDWRDIDFLLQGCADRSVTRAGGKKTAITRTDLELVVSAFESMPEGEGILEALLAAESTASAVQPSELLLYEDDSAAAEEDVAKEAAADAPQPASSPDGEKSPPPADSPDLPDPAKSPEPETAVAAEPPKKVAKAYPKPGAAVAKAPVAKAKPPVAKAKPPVAKAKPPVAKSKPATAHEATPQADSAEKGGDVEPADTAMTSTDATVESRVAASLLSSLRKRKEPPADAAE